MILIFASFKPLSDSHSDVAFISIPKRQTSKSANYLVPYIGYYPYIQSNCVFKNLWIILLMTALIEAIAVRVGWSAICNVYRV